MAEKDTNKGSDGQISLFDFIGKTKKLGATYSVADLNNAILLLKEAQYFAGMREKEEVAKRKEEERLKKEQEEKERQEEHVREVTCMDLPLDWNNVFDTDERTQGVHTDSIPDALIMSLTTLGFVDIEYISAITGADYKTVISALKGSIYQNPDTWGECFYKGWETADEYLSGNLMRKWKAAQKANKDYAGYFADNIAAIEKVLPPSVATEDIYVTLGSPWVPADIIDDFITHLFGEPPYPHNKKEWEDYLKTVHDPITGTWEIHEKGRFGHISGGTKEYRTGSVES